MVDNCEPVAWCRRSTSREYQGDVEDVKVTIGSWPPRFGRWH